MTMRDSILDAAEVRVRGGGFVAMSFRDLASDVGIKSSSVHYHFATKHELGEALVARYTEQFRARLDEIDMSDLERALAGFVAIYANALVLNETICLCAVMGAEAIGLPEHVNDRTKAFFRLNIGWLETLLTRHGAEAPADAASLIVSALEGGMIIASASNDRNLFDQVARAALCCVPRKALDQR